MNPIAPRWALTAQAVDNTGSPHLAKGVHLRVVPSPRLGLPIAPFMVYRLLLGRGADRAKARGDIVWVDSHGSTLTAPFSVSPDNPVTGYLPPPSQALCCWIWVDAAPATDGIGIVPIRSYLRVDAQVGTPRGPAVVASDTRAPYQLGASRIEQVVVTGRGRVNGVRWVDARTLVDGWQPWRLLALPLPYGARYSGIANADVEADKRVLRGAPLMMGLHDAPTAPDPASCPPATPPDEAARLKPLQQEIYPYVKELINDMSAPPYALTDHKPFMQDGKQVGTADINLLATVLQSGMDPGMGRWLGFMDLDDAPMSTTAGDVVAYGVRGIWAMDPDYVGKDLMQTLPKEAVLDQMPRPVFGDKPVMEKPPGGVKGPFLDMWAIAVTTIGFPSDRPLPPLLDNAQDGPWLPVPAPTAIRELIQPVRGVVPGAVIAMARKESGGIIGLNRKSSAGRAISLMLAVPDNATSAGQGYLADRTAPPQAFAYRVAQADWFGRWSDWAEHPVGAKARPLPPTPVIHPTYLQPAVPAAPAPVPTGPMAGQIKVRVSVPPPDALAPASYLLAQLQVAVNGVTTPFPIADPANPPDHLDVVVAGPAIDRAGHATATVTARWQDTNGGVGADAEETVLDLYDPRPPVQLSFPNPLDYGSRPDVTGHSRIALTWTADPSQKRYRVYYGDETAVMAKLSASNPTLAASLAGKSAPDRAAIFKANAGLLQRAWFELLTGVPLENPGGAAAMAYEHRVSGSLRVLCFYKVVPISQAQVEADFTTAALAIFGVPNTGAPTLPLLETVGRVVQGDAHPYQVDVKITVPRGQVPATHYRVRRATTAVSDVMHMPIVHTDTIDPAAAGAMQTVTYHDTGAWDDLGMALDLKPWTPYYYAAEVQGPPEPGSDVPPATLVPGVWSAVSPVTRAVVVPPDAPAAIDDIAVVDMGMALQVRFHHPDRLTGGAMGQYKLDVYVTRAGESEKYLGSAWGGSQDHTGWFTFTDTDTTPGASYRVLVSDPIGRTSAPSVSATLGG